MFCSKCGNDIADGARFCSSCGMAVDSADETAAGAGDYDEASGGASAVDGGSEKSGLVRNNKGGLIVAVAIIVLCLYTSFVGEGEESFSFASVIVGAPFAVFTGCIGWAIAKKLKEHLAPDVVYYTKTSSLIAKKLWWGGGIHVFCSAIGAFVPIGIVQLIINALLGIE